MNWIFPNEGETAEDVCGRAGIGIGDTLLICTQARYRDGIFEAISIHAYTVADFDAHSNYFGCGVNVLPEGCSVNVCRAGLRDGHKEVFWPIAKG